MLLRHDEDLFVMQLDYPLSSIFVGILYHLSQTFGRKIAAIDNIIKAISQIMIPNQFV
jgi:hypothetical protein